MPKTSRVTSLGLILTLFVGPLSRAQPVRPPQIQLRIVVGDNAACEIESLQTKKLVVEVMDEAGIPVSGAAVTFRLPEEGATGLFPGGNRSAVVDTSAQGQAVAPDIRWGGSPGTVSIRITAVKGSAHAGILAPQQLTARSTPAAGATVPAGPVPAQRSVTTASQASATSTATATVTKAASSPLPVPVPITSQVTIMTQPEKSQPDPIARASIRPSPLPTAAAAKAAEPPTVAISGAPPGHGSSGKTKWILLGIAAAGAVAGVAFAMGNNKSSNTTTAPPSGATIGAPSISIGHP
jgi:hypothetical protein